MRKINTKIHGLLDYSSALLLLLPWITSSFNTEKGVLVLAMTGTCTVILSLLTDYEFGFLKLIPMKVHLLVDVLQALFLLSLPLIFPSLQYAYYWPSVLGAAELLIVCFSRPQPYTATLHETHMSR